MSKKKEILSDNSLILKRLEEIENMVTRLKEFHMGEDPKSKSIFKVPSMVRQWASMIGRLEEIDRKISRLKEPHTKKGIFKAPSTERYWAIVISRLNEMEKKIGMLQATVDKLKK